LEGRAKEIFKQRESRVSQRSIDFGQCENGMAGGAAGLSAGFINGEEKRVVWWHCLGGAGGACREEASLHSILLEVKGGLGSIKATKVPKDTFQGGGVGGLLLLDFLQRRVLCRWRVLMRVFRDEETSSNLSRRKAELADQQMGSEGVMQVGGGDTLR